MFRLAINDGEKTKGFYNAGQIVNVEPMCVADFSLVPSIPRGLTEIKNFLQEMDTRGKKEFYLQRYGAIGDVLMAVPAIRFVQNYGYNIFLKTVDQTIPVLELLGIRTLQAGRFTPGIHGLLTDQVIERDHTEEELGKIHRVFIYMKLMGVDNLPQEVDWSCDLSKFPKIPFDADEKFVVFQGQGTAKNKRLKDKIIETVVRRLNREGIKVYTIGGPETFNFDSGMTKNLKKILRLPELFSLIGMAKCLICMDSAPLWISHFTVTPVVVILGPTAEKQRLSLHPLYPDGAMAIALNEKIDCKNCRENAVACNFKFTCLDVDADLLADEIIKRVADFLD